MLCLLAKKVKEHKMKETQIMNPSLDFYFILFLCSVTTKCVKVLILIVEIQNASLYDFLACHLGLCCYEFKLTMKMKNW